MSKNRPEPTMELVDITPELAKEFLTKNAVNRRVRPDIVERLSKIILNGEWQVNADTFRFDWNGNMIDGQHRALAILATGVTVKSYVATGLAPESQETIDMGIKRTLSDILHLRGEKNTNQLAATISLLFRWDQTVIFNNARNNPTPGQALAFLEKHPEIRDAVRTSLRLSPKVDLSSTIIAACYYRFHEIDPDDARDFWQAVTTGFYLDESPARPDSSPYVLTKFLNREGRGQHKTPQYILHGMVVKAWNAYRENRSVRLLSFKASERFPEPV